MTAMTLKLTCNQLHQDVRAEIKEWDKKHASSKGIKITLLGWGAALLTLPIPIVHFVAPPLLLLASPILGFTIYKMYLGKKDLLLQGAATCPSCKAPLTMPKSFETYPQSINCPHCQSSVYSQIL